MDLVEAAQRDHASPLHGGQRAGVVLLGQEVDSLAVVHSTVLVLVICGASHVTRDM